MKKLLLFTFLLVGFVANARYVQVTFNEGFYIYAYNPDPYQQWGNATSDVSINSILANHGVTYCQNSPDPLTLFFEYTGSNVSSFVTELYSNINVDKVALCYDSSEYYFPTFADYLHIKLLNITNGNPVGVNSNGNVITNNSELNSIYEIFNVKIMQQPPLLSNYYEIYFEGDITGLKNALDSLDSVIEFTYVIDVPMLLSNEPFDKSDIQIYPNPFQNNFTIQTEKTISTYSLFDISGKKLIDSFSKNEIDNISSQLNSGVYFINLEFQDGQKTNYKLIKE